MSGSVSKSFCLSSPLKVEEEPKVIDQKQGIVSILDDCERTKAASLRRALSADMSSKKWLARNGFSSPMKKIASSEQLANSAADSSSSSEEEEEEEKSAVWRQILSEKEKKLKKPEQLAVWSSILLQKAEDSSKLPPPYVHPLVKRSSSSLTKKSLEICTESLGSETGSDQFSSYPSSEAGDVDEEKEEAQEEERESQSFDREEVQVVKYNYSAKKLLPRSFPPPITSLNRSDGPSLRMHSQRKNGRLVLEAVSISSQNYFQAQRQDGRLCLSLVNCPSEEPNHEAMIDQEEDKVEEFEDVFEVFDVGNGVKKDEDEDEDEDDEDEDEDEDEENENEDEEEMGDDIEKESGANYVGVVMEQAPKQPISGVINVHRAALMMKKLMWVDNRNPTPTWPHKFNKAINLMEVEVVEEEEEQPTPLPQSLPPPPRIARLIPSPQATAAASFNSYEYFWRTKPAVANLINPLTQKCPILKYKSNNVSDTPKAYEQQEMVLLRRNNTDYLVPSFKGCKESRRSLLIWEPYCIVTSQC